MRQKLINILWSYDELSESQIQEIVNKIMKAVSNEK